MFNAYAVNTLQLDPALCNGCALCMDVCPQGVFELRERKAVASGSSRCMECGACMLNCPTEAIRVNSGTGCATAMFLAALRGLPMEEGTCG